MILFVNFAPITFMGGAEKWMNDMAKKVSTHENTKIVSVDPKIANMYGELVLNRRYDKRVKTSTVHNQLILDINSFIPFTKSWKKARKIFANSSLIYTRHDVLEFLIIMYFSNISGLQKTIAGLHTPFIYSDPKSFFDRLHNELYSSWVYKSVFSQIKKVHVLNTKDEKYLRTLFKLKNVVYVPNGVDMPTPGTKITASGKIGLKVLFVGELSIRKGVDILGTIIKKTPLTITFTIAGDGHLQNFVKNLTEKFKNVHYCGYVKKDRLDTLYRQNDALILPSRAESMSLSALEAMSYGLVIVDSINTSLGLDRKVEYSCDNKNIKTYSDTLKKLSVMKTKRTLSKPYVRTYCNKNFASSLIDRTLLNNIFDIHTP